MSCCWPVSGPGVRVWEATDLIGLVSVWGGGSHRLALCQGPRSCRARKIQGGSHRLALCQGPRSCRARNRETQSKDPWLKFRQITPFQTQQVCANVHLRQSFWKTVKVTKRACDVTPRSKYQKSKGHPWTPCALNLVQFRLLFTASYGILKKMAHVIFLWSAAILKVSVEPYRFSNIP